jgi:hypothetical protein
LLLLDTPALRPFAFMGATYHVEILNWSGLIEATRQAPPSAAVLVEAFPGGPDTPNPKLKELIAVAQSIPVLAGFDFASARHTGVRLLAEWGIDDMVDLPIEHTPQSLLIRLETVHALPFKKRLVAALSREVSPNALTLMIAAAGTAADGGLSNDLANAFGVGERTMGSWCAREGLPPPRRLLAWLRVLLGLMLLEQPWRTVRDTARAVGYVDDSTFRRAAVALLGEKIQLRGESFAKALAAFTAELPERPRFSRGPEPRGPIAK